MDGRRPGRRHSGGSLRLNFVSGVFSLSMMCSSIISGSQVGACPAHYRPLPTSAAPSRWAKHLTASESTCMPLLSLMMMIRTPIVVLKMSLVRRSACKGERSECVGDSQGQEQVDVDVDRSSYLIVTREMRKHIKTPNQPKIGRLNTLQRVHVRGYHRHDHKTDHRDSITADIHLNGYHNFPAFHRKAQRHSVSLPSV